MSELNVNQEEVKSATRDESLDLSSFLKPTAEPIAEEKPKELSPLEKMRMEQNEMDKGMVINNADMAPKQLKDNKEITEGMEHIEEAIEDMEKLIDVSKQVEVTKVPTHPTDMAAIMMELQDAADTGLVKAEGGFIAKRGDPMYMSAPIEGRRSTPVDVEKIAPEVKENLKLIIDKTGYGADIILTPEEKEKVRMSTEIHLIEVETLEIETYETEREEVELDFLDTINEYELANSRVSAIFPASGFRGALKGLSFGEMGDIALNAETLEVEHLKKQYSVIYNKLIDTNIPKFETFTEFLNNFAYTDVPYALNALVIATFPEVDELSMICDNRKCGQTFYHKFAPRTLLQLDATPASVIELSKNILNTESVNGVEVYKSSPLKKKKYFTLPQSKIRIVFGVASCQDWLDMVMKNLLDEKFREKYDDIKDTYRISATMLSNIREIHMPKKDGKYRVFKNADNMIGILHNAIPHEDMVVLFSIISKYIDEFQVKFAVKDVVCPHCNTKSSQVNIIIDNLLFFKTLKQDSTWINTDNIQVL